MKLLLPTALAAAFMVSLAASASAQDGELRDFCADRPGKGTPTCILDQGHIQLEVGLFDGARQRDDAFKYEGDPVKVTIDKAPEGEESGQTLKLNKGDWLLRQDEGNDFVYTIERANYFDNNYSKK